MSLKTATPAALSEHQRAGRACVQCGVRFDLTGVHRVPVVEDDPRAGFVCDWVHHVAVAA